MFNKKECNDEENLSLKEKAIKQLEEETVFIDKEKIEDFKKKLENIFA